jgi:DNA invertase Pin-like site-specific DNA recombinase
MTMSSRHLTNGTNGHATPELAVALYRISDDDKQDSLPTQREWSQRVTQRDGLRLVAEFEDEGISGAAVSRPGLEDLCAFVQRQFYARDPVRYLLLIDLDRFLRRDSISTGAWLDKLRTHGLRYIITTAQRFDLHNSLDRTLIALGSDFTREPELRAKSNHALNGMAERARRGLWMGGAPPYGYRLGTDGHLTPGPEDEVEVLRWIFRTYASGRLTATGIARELNARGVKARRSKGGHWCQRTVLAMLKNRAYLGCTAWGGQMVGRYHRLEKGMVVPREDKYDREQQQLLRKLKHLPVSLAGDEDLIVCPGAHPALIDRELFDACQRQRERNKENYSAPRDFKPVRDADGNVRRPGKKGNVWPLAGQRKCGHCGEPIWTLPLSPSHGGGEPLDRARLACSQRRADGPDACPHSGAVRYALALGRVVALLQEKLADPGAVAEMTREYERQVREQERAGTTGRQRLEAKAAKLDAKIADAVANLAHTPEDLRADVVEYVRGLKAERGAVGQQLRDLDTAEREAKAVDPEEFRATLDAVAGLEASWDSREEAELLRATLRDLVAEVRLSWRARRKGDQVPNATKRVLARVEVDLTPQFAELLTTASPTSSATARSPTTPTPRSRRPAWPSSRR